MSVTREAIVLPALFLTVALLGGFRIAGTVRLVPPPLFALVLGILLLGTLARAGVLAPERLMNAGRSALANISGLIVLVTLFAASAQIFNLVTPDRGLLHAVFSVCFLVQLATTLAGVTGRRGLLRSLVVLLGSAFLLRFVVLESLYAPDGGMVNRLITTLLGGASLGTIEYQPNAAATGYVAFLTIALYVTGLILLPTAEGSHHEGVVTVSRRTELMLLAVAVMLAGSACGGVAASPPAAATGKAMAREEALRAARVWRAPPIPIAQVSFADNPEEPGGFRSTEEVSCRLVLQKVGGTTPKFYCQLTDGRIVKVKYGRNPELHAEVAATRLLAALGFGADRMYVVRAVRCAGCPRFPFQALRCAESTGSPRLCFAGEIDHSRVRTFETAAIERRIEGKEIEASEDQGWAWFELDKIDARYGGSSPAEVDAFRLLAVLLAHWDNKAPNQRLICLPGGEQADGRCATPIAIMQDLGATFGPTKLDLHNWRAVPVWADRQTCTVSMVGMPFHGGTFPPRRLSEEGRLMLARLLAQISEPQLVDLFTSSRIVTHDQIAAEARDARAWARAFRDKVRQVEEGSACPQ